MYSKINYEIIPVLAIGFTRSNSLIAKSIQLFRGILKDATMPNHVFFVTEDHGQLFATEETLQGLRENSMEQYTSKGNHIVALYSWVQFDNPLKREQAMQYLSEIRRRAKENSKYDWKGLLSFVPGFKWIKPDGERQWCSENVASIIKLFGGDFVGKTTISPDELLKLIRKNINEFRNILNFYK